MASLFDTFKDFLISVCPDIKWVIDRLHSEEIDIKNVFLQVTNEYIAVKGHVQSGKTNFMVCMCMLSLWFKVSCVVIVRNLQADKDQFLTRLDDFKQKCIMFIPSIRIIKTYSKKTEPRTKPCIYVCLGNNTSINNVLELLPNQPFVTCIDEVDALDVSMGKSKRNEVLQELKTKSLFVLGISATLMDPLQHEYIRTTNIIILRVPEDYKGIYDIQFHPLEGKSTFCGKVTDDLLSLNEPLQPFLEYFSQRPPTSIGHPHIGLLNICSTIHPYEKLQQYMLDKFPTILTIVYNSKGLSLGYEGKITTRKETIQECLQWCKEEGGVVRFPYILICSGQLAGRGISFTDMEYDWHIQVLYLLVSGTCNEMELIQKNRLCGRYKDVLPLEIYTTRPIYTDLLKAFYRQEEIITNISTNKYESSTEQLENMTLCADKFTKRPVLKNGKLSITKTDDTVDNEWSMSVYKGQKFPDTVMKEGRCTLGDELDNDMDRIITEDETKENIDKEIQRLSKKMFKKWSKLIEEQTFETNEKKTTVIAKWMNDLEPSKEYTEDEMKKLCKKYGISSIELVMKIKFKSNSNGYGKIIVNKGGVYQLDPLLVPAYEEYFGRM